MPSYIDRSILTSYHAERLETSLRIHGFDGVFVFNRPEDMSRSLLDAMRSTGFESDRFVPPRAFSGQTGAISVGLQREDAHGSLVPIKNATVSIVWYSFAGSLRAEGEIVYGT